jgi:outer membrane lipoprotein carrier protein
MRKLLVILGLVGVLAAEDAATAFKAVRAHYSKVKSLSGEFTQKICGEDLGYCMDMEGKFSASRPNLFRFDVSDPEEQLIVGDGEYTWIYWPGNNLVRKTASSEDPFFEVLLGGSEGVFRAESIGTEDGTELIVLVPADSMAGFDNVRLNVSPRDHTIVRITLDDGFGTITTYALSNVKYNPSLPAKTFQFTPPEGTVVEE